MNQALHDSLAALAQGPATTIHNLTVIALLRRQDVGEPDYLTLDEALKSGVARVTEMSQAGTVPELCFENNGDLPVLLLDGEELVGAKQNRILNLSIFAPAKKTITVPVSCVEAGRWNYHSSEFATEGRAFYAEGRMQKMRQVSASMQSTGSRRTDQSAVWDNIAMKSSRMGVHSSTGAMADIYRDRAERIEDYVKAVARVDGQVGAAFSIDGQLRGIEFFDFPQTMGRLLPKLVRSYALDAMDDERRPANDDGENHTTESENASTTKAEASFSRFLDEVKAARVEQFSAVGEGEDLRLIGNAVAGGALAARGRVVHLCAFRINGPQVVHEGGIARLARATTRAARYRPH